MKTQTFEDIVMNDLLPELIIHDVYPGFREDYLVLQCLIRIHKPKTFMEIGTNTGNGVRCINAAMLYYCTPKIYSLDLDYETMRKNSAQYPLDADGTDRVGSDARDIPYTQLRGDSLTFDYYAYPCEGYYIDGEHDEEHSYYESLKAFAQQPKIIIWHDSDMPEVMQGIIEAFAGMKEYQLYQVTDTRIAYAIRK